MAEVRWEATQKEACLSESRTRTWDAVVVGAGPNGLAAAIRLAQAGRSVLVCEAAKTVGGGSRSAELTLPGFVHDICSAIHPLAASSPFFATMPLAKFGLEWVQPPAACAHPLDDGTAVVLERSIDETAAGLGEQSSEGGAAGAPQVGGRESRSDGAAYRRVMAPLVADWDRLRDDLLGPLRFPPHHPVALARFGLRGLRSAKAFAESTFAGRRGRALFAGVAAHSMLPLDRAGSAAFALVLMASGHSVGWPMARGGSQHIADALAGYFLSLGGRIEIGRRIDDIDQLPPASVTLFDVTPRQLVSIADTRLPARYRAALGRYRYGLAVFKLDWALDGPIPWTAVGCARAATVHVGGELAEITASEAAVWRGGVSDKPFVIVVQQSLFDPSRAPQGKQTGWAYCHVPNGWRGNATEVIEAQIERFAPGFCDLILARHISTPAALEAYDANYVGGDINGGVQDLRQLFMRPVTRWNPYSTPADGIFLCSSSTPPGGGVHGMCGYHAALTAIAALEHRPAAAR